MSLEELKMVETKDEQILRDFVVRNVAMAIDFHINDSRTFPDA